jgi:glucosylceramidase
MILDNKGGPNHKKNYCNAPIMLNKDNSNYIKNLTFYYIGHFSRYIHPGATRIGFSKFTDALEVTAFKNIDSSTVVVIMNKTNDNIEFNINLNNELLKDVINSHSIITYTF